MPDEYSSWETEETSGLLDNFDFTVETAEFATDARYMNGERLILKWTGTAIDEEGIAHTDHEMWLGCGDGWESRDGGRTAVHAGGKTVFNAASTLGKVINRMVKELDMQSVLEARGRQTEADAYQGLKFHIKREKLNFGSGIDNRPQAVPVAFLGEASGAAASTPAAPAVSSNGNVALLAKVKLEAKNHTTHDEFLGAVLEKFPEIADDEALFARVVDADGLWSEAKA